MAGTYADLHLHTYFSDGTESPEEMVKRAREKGFSCVAIADHDTIAGVERALAAGTREGLEVVPAAELSAELAGREVHILGYFIDHTDPWFVGKLQEICDYRVKRIATMIEKLHEHGIPLRMEDVVTGQKAACVGRLHLANALLEQGYVYSRQEAFTRYIGDEGPCYVSNFNFTPEEAVAIIRRAKGVPVLAHPYIIGTDRDIERFIAAGICGLEVYHSDHRFLMVERFKRLAEKHGLLMTGGSDCHGAGKPRVLLGTIKLPLSYVEQLRAKSREIAALGS